VNQEDANATETAAREYAARALSEDVPVGDIVDNLVSQGIDMPLAYQIVREGITSPSRNPFPRSNLGLSDIKLGVGLLIAAAAITFLSYQLAPAFGGRYMMTTGLGLFGIICLVRGAWRFFRR
jgi:hypothetical protein